MHRAIIVVLSLLVLGVDSSAQDRIYTQYYAVPSYLNPALTGGFGNNFRASAIYRDQWRGAIDAPLRNITLNTEFKLPLVNSKNGDAAALGINFSSLKAGLFEWGENTLGISGAFHKVLNPKIDQVLSGGVQVELNQRNILFEDLTFQDQFNGTDAFDQITDEELPDNNFGFLNFNVGLNYSSNVGENDQLFLGAAVHHVNGAEVSFYANDEDEEQQVLGTFQLGMKYTLHGGYSTELNSSTQLLPRFLVQVQDDLLHALVGSNLRFEQRSNDGQAFHLGRMVSFKSQSRFVCFLRQFWIASWI